MSRVLKQSSMDLYTKTLDFLMNKLDKWSIQNAIDYIFNSKNKRITKLNQLNALISLNKHDKLKMKANEYKELSNIRDELQIELEKEHSIDNQTPKTKEILSKLKFDDILELKKKLKEIKMESLNNLQDYILISLLIIYPLRNDMRALKIAYDSKNINTKENFLLINEKLKKIKIILNDYKTSWTYGTLVLDMNDNDLIENIISFCKRTGRKYLFEHNLNPLTSIQMTRFINNLFKKYLNIDNVSWTILRKVYLNHKYKNTIDNMKDDAHMMGNSIGVQ